MSLLVSVQDVDEAEIAISAKVDWLDVKDPQRGALGCPNLEVALSIERLAHEKSPQLRVSVALGESCDSNLEGLVRYAQSFRSTTSFKLAFSDPRMMASTRSGETHGWCVLFRELVKFIPDGRLIPVFYADWREAGAPDWDGILQLAVDTSCKRILIDTFLKNGRGLTDHLPWEQLRSLATIARKNSISLAIAGSIRKSEIPALRTIGADVIGVRGAACKGGNRKDSIDAATLQELTAIFKS